MTPPKHNWPRLVAAAFLLAGAIEAAAALSLERNVGTPASYDWDGAIAWAKDPLLTPVLGVLKQYNIPSAAIGYQLNPSPSSVPYSAPSSWRNPQTWWMAGFGVDYRAPMRVASVSKRLTYAVFVNRLNAYSGSKFYSLWLSVVGPLPEPKDPRVKSITVQHLLDHVSGLDNGKIGYDPAFQGKTVTAQLGPILSSTSLLADPGATYSYSNFGYMILAQLAEGITGQSMTQLARDIFPGTPPIFAASDSTPVSSTAGAGAAEPSIYYVQSPDGEFDVTPMKGNGNVVTNVATLSWFATQFYLGGAYAGKKISAVPWTGGYTYIANGAMPGTMAVLVQSRTPKGLMAAVSININTRVPNSGLFFDKLNDAAATFLSKKFAAF